MPTRSSEYRPVVENGDPAHRNSIELHSMTRHGEEEESQKPKDNRDTKCHTSNWQPWRWEVASCFVALLAIAFSVIVVVLFDGKPLPKWHARLSINSVIAIASVIFKFSAAMPVTESLGQLKWSWFTKRPRPAMHLELFDQASRGKFLGSTKLIYQQRGLHLASLGALAMMISAVTDPFFQQLVRNVPCYVDDGLVTASMPRTNNYSDSGTRLSAFQHSLDAPMMAAIYQGIYDSAKPVSPTCSTGNCSFADYQTIGMCSGCEDRTKDVTFDNSTRSQTFIANWTLPSGPSLTLPGPNLLNVSSTNFLYALLDGPSNASGVDQDKLIRTDLIHLDNVDDPVVGAESCWLTPCVMTYSLTVNSSKVSSNLLTTQLLDPPMQNASAGEKLYGPWSGIPTFCIVNGKMVSATESQSQCQYSYNDWLGFANFITGFLIGNASLPQAGGASPDYMAQVCDGGNCTLDSLRDTWTNLANAIAFHMQENGTPGSNEALQGVAYQSQVCIQARWYWLIFPVSLLILVTVLLVATIVEMPSSLQHCVWKSSPLELLFHGLDSDLKDKCQSVKETELFKSQLSLRLCHSEDTIEFRESHAGGGTGNPG